MTLNFQAHGNALQTAYNRVALSQTGNEWVIYDYEGNTNVLKTGEEGEDGLDEFSTSFNSGRLQFGVIAVRLSPTVLPKIVLVHWQGEGVPTTRLATTATHFEDVRRFLKTVHVIVHARSDIDVEPEAIQREVAKLPAANASVNVESSYSTPERVSSNYQPVRPHVDLNSRARQEFWDKMNGEEKQRVEEDRAARESQQKQYDEERQQLAQEIRSRRENEEETARVSYSEKPQPQVATRPDNASGPGKGRLIGSRLGMFDKKDEKPIVPSAPKSVGSRTTNVAKKWPPVSTNHESVAPIIGEAAKPKLVKDANENTYIPPSPSEVSPQPPSNAMTPPKSPVAPPPSSTPSYPSHPTTTSYDDYEEPPCEPEPVAVAPSNFASQYDFPPPSTDEVTKEAVPPISQYDFPPTVDTTTTGVRALALWDYQAGQCFD
ncbi:unnamed protein product [Caenorhabditis auriculariae]|uniref:ADF-H domain-containing protein n=1 Tax=Caenorhabditis auriculariae TaxID=2777116 RepID=A0A8S1GWS4_9PELO|nr:unnamed protein product [Caenorhabditis auriculariae]